MAEGLKRDQWGTITIRVPPELKSYGPSLTRFFDAMIFKLRRNAHKGKWENLPLEKAIRDLEGEVGELVSAADNGNTSEILMEGADVANEALIITEIALEARHAMQRDEAQVPRPCRHIGCACNCYQLGGKDAICVCGHLSIEHFPFPSSKDD